jgi:hypothetical protein
MDPKERNSSDNGENERLAVSLNTLAGMLDAHRSSVRRWLQEAGIRPIVLGRGRNGAIRYRWRDINEWLKSREDAE